MKTIPVPGQSFNDTPPWWQNFVIDAVNWWDARNSDTYDQLPEKLKDRHLNNRLRKFHAQLVLRDVGHDDTEILGITFDEDKYLTTFLLKYNYENNSSSR
jgi:hypothetical protein